MGCVYRQVLRHEVGIAALVVQLFVCRILAGDGGEVGGVVVQVIGSARRHKVRPSHKFVFLPLHQGYVEGGSIGSSPFHGLRHRLHHYGIAFGIIHRQLVAQVILRAVHIGHAALGAVGVPCPTGTRQGHGFGSLEGDAHHALFARTGTGHGFQLILASGKA